MSDDTAAIDGRIQQIAAHIRRQPKADPPQRVHDAIWDDAVICSACERPMERSTFGFDGTASRVSYFCGGCDHGFQIERKGEDPPASGSRVAPPGEIVQLQQARDAAGERESIASLVADREEMTVYLKVEAALKELESREAEIVQLRQERADIIAAIDEVAPDPDKPLVQRVRDEMHDYRMVIEHCTKAYYHMTNGRISKPNTLFSEVQAVAEDCLTELVQEETRELEQERDALLSRLRGLSQQWRDEVKDRAGSGCGCYGKSTMQRQCADQLDQILPEGSRQQQKKEIDTR